MLGPIEDRISSVKSHWSKKRLNFETTIEQPTEQPTEKRTNILNLPYTDSEPEQEDESPVIKSPEHSIEFA